MDTYVMSEEEIACCEGAPSVLATWQMAPHFWAAGTTMLEATVAHIPTPEAMLLDLRSWSDLSFDERRLFVVNLVENRVMLQCGAWVSAVLIFGDL